MISIASEIPIEKGNYQVLDAGSHQKEDKIMDTNLRLEQLVDQHIAENKIEAAVSTLYRLIVTYAKEKNFTKAELLREKLYEIDSMALNEIISSAEIIEQEKSELSFSKYPQALEHVLRLLVLLSEKFRVGSFNL